MKITPSWKLIRIGLGIICGTLAFAGCFSIVHKVASFASFRLPSAKNAPAAQVRTPFPTISLASLTPEQVKVLDIARAEYAKGPVSYDAEVMTYTQGNQESWCADFASWVMLQAGSPYSNPNSGSWRIPGVYTLQEYYQGKNTYSPVGNYVPKPGDVAIYNSAQAHDPSGNLHAAIVISAEDGKITTIGGNEGGRMSTDTRPLQYGNDGLVGFGRL